MVPRSPSRRIHKHGAAAVCTMGILLSWGCSSYDIPRPSLARIWYTPGVPATGFFRNSGPGGWMNSADIYIGDGRTYKPADSLDLDAITEDNPNREFQYYSLVCADPPVVIAAGLASEECQVPYSPNSGMLELDGAWGVHASPVLLLECLPTASILTKDGRRWTRHDLEPGTRDYTVYNNVVVAVQLTDTILQVQSVRFRE